MVKEGWSFLSVGLEVQRTMADMEKRQEKGELGEDEAKEIEMNLSGTLLLVAWKGSKFELSTVLRQVVDGGEFFSLSVFFRVMLCVWKRTKKELMESIVSQLSLKNLPKSLTRFS